jgi:hypothetical protein
MSCCPLLTHLSGEASVSPCRVNYLVPTYVPVKLRAARRQRRGLNKLLPLSFLATPKLDYDMLEHSFFISEAV